MTEGRLAKKKDMIEQIKTKLRELKMIQNSSACPKCGSWDTDLIEITKRRKHYHCYHCRKGFYKRKEVIQLINCEVPIGVPIIIEEVAPQRWGYRKITNKYKKRKGGKDEDN